VASGQDSSKQEGKQNMWVRSCAKTALYVADDWGSENLKSSFRYNIPVLKLVIGELDDLTTGGVLEYFMSAMEKGVIGCYYNSALAELFIGVFQDFPCHATTHNYQVRSWSVEVLLKSGGYANQPEMRNKTYLPNYPWNIGNEPNSKIDQGTDVCACKILDWLQEQINQSTWVVQN